MMIPRFFEQYSHMQRSIRELEGAGEWHELKKMLPDFSGKRVLDLGCGFGWHCRYAAEHGAVFKNQRRCHLYSPLLLKIKNA